MNKLLFEKKWAIGALYKSQFLKDTSNECVMDVQLGLRCWVSEYKRLVCESNRKRQGALRAGAGSAGRDNDPGGLGYMPDSQGPNMTESQYRDMCFGAPRIHRQESLPPWHPPREGNNQWTFIH